METTPQKTKKVRKPTAKATASNPNEGTFVVKTKGYKEQFSSLDSAKRAYGTLKRKKISEGDSFKIELSKKGDGANFDVIEQIEKSED